MQGGHFFFLHASVQRQREHLYTECPCVVLGAFTNCNVHYLLNIVDPIHWIIYFLPSWGKF